MKIIPLILEQLKGVRSTGKGYQAMCPTHQDRQPSLSIDPGERGWMMYCHRGCSTRDVMEALGFPVQALFYDYVSSLSSYDPSSDLEFDVWIQESKPWSPCWKLHKFDEVTWAGILREPQGWARANAEWHPYTSDLFPVTMRMWVNLSDSWLYDWLGEWHLGMTMNWKETKEWANQRIWEAWIEKGCSTCQLEPNPRPVPG